jgi:hypothetical protein
MEKKIRRKEKAGGNLESFSQGLPPMTGGKVRAVGKKNENYL